MRRSRVQFLVAAPRARRRRIRTSVSACGRWISDRTCQGVFVDKVMGRGQNSAPLLGGVPERSKGSDCKSDGLAFEGSNPSPSTTYLAAYRSRARRCRRVEAMHGGYSSVAEPQPSKLMARVRFPLPAPTSGRVTAGCRPAMSRDNGTPAHIAQSVEHFLGKEEVIGSIPIVGFAKKYVRKV